MKILIPAMLLTISMAFVQLQANAQNSSVAIGDATPKSNAVLYLRSPGGNQGLIIPIVSSPGSFGEAGMIVYGSVDKKVFYHNGTDWTAVGTGSGGGSTYTLSLSGNSLILKDATSTVSTVPIAATAPAAANQFLMWDGAKWIATSFTQDAANVNGIITVNGLKGKALPALPSTTQVLVYNGTAWVFQALTGGTDSQDLSLNTTTNVLSLTNDVTTVDLTPYKQNLGLTGTGSATTGESFPLNISSGTGVTIKEGTNVQIDQTANVLTINSVAGGSGTVTNVSVASANGVSGTVTNPTTTPAITVSLGAITPTSVAATGTVTGSNLSGTNTGDNAVNTLYSGLVSNATHTGDATGSTALLVRGINGVLVSGLGTGILKNTTGTGVPSIATGADLPVMTATVSGAVPTPPNNTTTFLRGDGTFATPAGGGTLTAVSVTTANGFSGTSSGGSTPAITLTTPVTGILKGNGTSMTAALNSDLPAMTATVGGAVPTPPNNTTTFLRGDGTFAAPATGMTNPLTTTGDIIYGVGTTPTRLAGATGVLKSTGAAAPAWGTVNLANTDVTGTLPVGNGGTGRTTWDGLLLGSGSTISDISTGTAGQILRVAGTTPSWSNFAVTSADITDGQITGADLATNINITTTGNITTNAPGNLSIAGTSSLNGATTLTSLAGAGTRMVVADPAGLLSTSTVPTVGWGLNGNAGTIFGTNFIGTTDAVSLSLKTNNLQRMFINSDGRIMININNTNVPSLHANAILDIVPNGAGIGNMVLRGSFTNPNDPVDLEFRTWDGATALGKIYMNPSASDMLFEANGATRLALQNDGDVGIGTTSPAQKLDVVGNVNVSSASTYMIGASTVLSNTGTGNIFVGANSGLLNTAISGTFVGAAAGRDNTSGTDNTFLGRNSGLANTTGTLNVYVGSNAGSNAGALTASGNTFVGYLTGATNTTGTRNILIGREANVGAASLTNATAIGYQAIVGASNSMVLGGAAGSGNEVKVGIGTTTPTTELQVNHGNGSPTAGNGLTIQNVGASNQNFALFVSNSTGNLNLYENTTFVGGFAAANGTYTPVSDKRLKKNITTIENVLPKLSEINIRRYHFKKQSDSELTNIGVIAQELKEVYPELVHYSPENDKYTVDYMSMGPLAIKAIQEQQKMIEKLLEKINGLENSLVNEQSENNELKTQLSQLASDVEQIKKSLGLDKSARKD